MDNIHLKERSKEEDFDVFAHYLKRIEMSLVRGDAIEKAEEVKKKYLEESGKFPPYTHEDLKNIAKMNGVEKIRYLEEITFGSINKDSESKNKYEIWLPEKEFFDLSFGSLDDENNERGNFTLAHEIGHIFAGDLKIIMPGSHEHRRREYYCNSFADGLLSLFRIEDVIGNEVHTGAQDKLQMFYESDEKLEEIPISPHKLAYKNDKTDENIREEILVCFLRKELFPTYPKNSKIRQKRLSDFPY